MLVNPVVGFLENFQSFGQNGSGGTCKGRDARLGCTHQLLRRSVARWFERAGVEKPAVDAVKSRISARNRKGNYKHPAADKSGRPPRRTRRQAARCFPVHGRRHAGVITG